MSSRETYARLLLEDAIASFSDLFWVDALDAPLGISNAALLGERYCVTVCLPKLVELCSQLDEREFHDHLIFLGARARLQIIFDGPMVDMEVRAYLARTAALALRRAETVAGTTI